MSEFESKYLQEKKKYENLLRMQKTILSDTDEYISAFSTIKQALCILENIEFDATEEIATDQAHSIAFKVCDLLKEQQKKCECQRWKSLYQQQAKESVKASRQKEQLINKLAAKEKQQQADRIEVNKLLRDYLDLYRKEVNNEKSNRKSQKKEKRSRSKGNPQTQRKGEGNKEDSQVGWVITKWEKDCGSLQRELENVRTQLVEKEKLLSIYRSKERRHLLAGGQLLD